MKFFNVTFLFILVSMTGLYLLYTVGKIYEIGLFCPDCKQDLSIGQIDKLVINLKNVLLFFPLFINQKLEFLKLTKDLEINTTITLFLSIFLSLLILYILYWIFNKLVNFFINLK